MWAWRKVKPPKPAQPQTILLGFHQKPGPGIKKKSRPFVGPRYRGVEKTPQTCKSNLSKSRLFNCDRSFKSQANGDASQRRRRHSRSCRCGLTASRVVCLHRSTGFVIIYQSGFARARPVGAAVVTPPCFEPRRRTQCELRAQDPQGAQRCSRSR